MECKGCSGGIEMCYIRPCWGTPEDLDKILDAGFAKLVQCDFYYRPGIEDESDIPVLTMGTHWEKGKRGENQDDIGNLLMSLFKKSKKDPKSLDYTIEHTGGEIAIKEIIPTKCVMLDRTNECLLHDMDLKPEQGRESCCKEDKSVAKDNIYYSQLWDTDKGKSVVEKWKQLVNFQDEQDN